jgi:hypothetical protein
MVNRTDHQRIDASSVIVVSRLDILRAVAPGFADESVVRLLNWQSTPCASAYWNAFLWFARISPDLYKKIEVDFLVALEHPGRIEERAYETLCQLFLLASMELRAVTSEITSRTIGNLSVDALGSLSSFIRHRMLNAKGGSANYWDNTVQPWLSAYWPRDHNKRSEGIMEDFAMTALYCGEHFPKALNWFEENGLLGRTLTATIILLSLRSENEPTHEDFKDSSSFPERFPTEVLHLLWITRPFQWDHGYGREILERLARTQPALKHSPKYHDLTELMV